VARQIAALAATTTKQVLRMKAFAAPLLFALTAAVASPFLPSDGTAAGAVRLAISANLVTASVFGALTAVMLSALVYARETADRTGYLLATKPVPRWGLFAGRVVGLSAVMAVVLAVMTFLSWILVSYVASRELARSPDAEGELANILTARDSVEARWETGSVRLPSSGPKGAGVVTPGAKVRWQFSMPPLRPASGRHTGRVALAEIRDDVRLTAVNPTTGERAALELQRDEFAEAATFVVDERLVARDPDNAGRPGQLDIELANESGAPARLTSAENIVVIAGAYTYLDPGRAYRWVFDLPAAAHDAPAFRLRVSRPYAEVQEVELAFSRDGSPGAAPEKHTLALGPRRMTILPVSRELLEGEGTLVVEMRSLSERAVRVPATGSLTFAPRCGTFAGALVRWMLLEFCKIVFLILVTCAGGTFLSFPVPALVGGVFALGGYLVSFVVALASTSIQATEPAVAIGLGVLAGILPDFTAASAVGLVYDGVLVPFRFIVQTAAMLLVVRGGIAAAIGALMSHRREYGA
jgi:ABC-type transport system involved in multi-copper enzyme maturation permease subunit